MDQDTYLTLLESMVDEHHDGFHYVPGAPHVSELFDLYRSPWNEVDTFLLDFETQGGA